MKTNDKLINYFENYTREKYFTDRVYLIRKELGIPRNGIRFPKKLPEYGMLFLPASILGISYKDKKLPAMALQVNIKPYDELAKRLPSIYKNLESLWFINVYILYNLRKYGIFDVMSKCKATELIKLRMEYLEMEGCCDCEIKVAEDFLKNKSERYPITIAISPYATQNEVIDFVKHQWDEIQEYFLELENKGEIPAFSEEKEQLAKLRGRKHDSKEIEDIVYKNKKLSLNALSELICEKTNKSLDAGEIGKIRSLAIKRREFKK